MSRLEDWVSAVASELDLPADLDADLDVAVVLDLARDVARGVARPAAPLTAFLVGLAAGRSGGEHEVVRGYAERIAALARSWPGPPAGPEREP